MNHTTIDLPNSHGCVITDLEPGEEALYFVRKHWVTLIQVTIIFLIVIALSVSVVIVGRFAQIPLLLDVLTAFGVMMIGMQYVFVQWLNNELDILIVTNRRVIEYDQVKFLDRKISQASIDQVQEVRASTSGLVGNLLRYGSLTIKTAGDASDFVLEQIPQALETSRVIHAFIDEYRHNLGDKATPGEK